MRFARGDVVCCVGFRQSGQGAPADLRFRKAGMVIGMGHDYTKLGNTFPLDISLWGHLKPMLQGLNSFWKQDYASQPHIQRRTASLREQGEWRARQNQEEMGSLASETPIHPNYLAHVASKVLPDDTVVVSENFRAADHLMPFGL